MSIVKNKDKRTGITYVYESESYWDKEKQQPRSHRRLIGKLDEATGEIIPTDGRGHNRKDHKEKALSDTTLSTESVSDEILKEKDREIHRLKETIAALEKEKAAVVKQLKKILDSVLDEEFS